MSTPMHRTHRPTIWEEGHEPGRQVAALGLALVLSATAADLWLAGRVTTLFDLVFVIVSLGVALLVRPRDFFTAGVLPPLLMFVVFLILGLTRPGSIAHPDDGVVQAVVSGLSRHCVALAIGYLGCLGCLSMRRRYLT